jgi:hypothetical protein
MIKFASDFRQVGGFPRWRHFSLPIKANRHDISEALLKASLNIITQAKLMVILMSKKR